MKKITSLVALFLVCFGITANAQNDLSRVGIHVVSASNPVTVTVDDANSASIDGVTAGLSLAVDPVDPQNPTPVFKTNAKFPNVAEVDYFAKGSKKVASLTMAVNGLPVGTTFKMVRLKLHGLSSKDVYCDTHNFNLQIMDGANNELYNGADINIASKNPNDKALNLVVKLNKDIAVVAGQDLSLVFKFSRSASDGKKYGFKIGVSDIVLDGKTQEQLEQEKFAEIKEKWHNMIDYVGFYGKKDVDAACAKENLAAARAFLKTCTPLAIDPAKIYRIVNSAHLTAMTVNGKGEQKVYKEGDANANMLWKFVKGTGVNDYKLYNVNCGKYLATPKKSQATSWLVNLTDESTAQVLTLQGLEGDAENSFSYADVNDPAVTHYLCGNTTHILEATADGDRVWYIKPVTQFGLELNPEDATVVDEQNHWATVYLPFKASAVSNMTCYGVEKVDGQSAVLTEVKGIVPNQGYIIKSNLDKVYFNIDAAATGVETPAFTNLLKGTNVDMPKVANCLVLGNDGVNGVGFYSMKTEAKTMDGNKAYLDNVPATTNALRFVFGEATGVENVEVAVPANAVYYDLSGRRVANPVKGIYVVNGKKVYVK